MKVYTSGDAKSGYSTEPCSKTISIRDVLCHTSGLTYGFDQKGIINKLDGIYYEMGLAGEKANKAATSLAEFVDRLAEAPLLFQPGTSWNYGYNVEVCGRLVEVLSGQPLDEFFQQRIFTPLRMFDTGFVVPPEKRSRFARIYMRAGAMGSMMVMPGSQRGKAG